MRRFLLTANRFNGAAILVYNDEGFLIALDLTQTNMPGKQLTWFFRNLPTRFEDNAETDEMGLQTFLNGREGVKVVEENIDITFDMFWLKYGKKINKDRCKGLWAKLTKAQQVAAYYGIWAYDRFLASLPWDRTKADPENYLKKKMWENEWQ